ncbi:PREDICTED: uncharacterized protein LOC104800252 [Tarenaya hassleriana]|uniref:uncharacterized protein LOC104800252 n=1 Tax=Tarenaya hassleriana TaxID=28532 RepID=UPI00053C1042|nr:PREDICTED: uncharacterized protein LOC104800252 [Tarenaya hassleriana]
MRARFLNIDYFSWASETLAFLNLPVADILPSQSHPFSVEEDKRILFGSVEDFHVPIGKLPIEAALSKFLFDVVPDRFGVEEYGDFEINDSPIRGCGYGDTRSLGFGASHFRENDNGAAVEHRDTQSSKIIQFETQELDFEMENMLLSKMEELQFFLEVLEVDTEPDNFGKSDVTLQNRYEIQQKIYLVDYISSNYFTEPNTLLTDEECFLKNKKRSGDDRFPLLEVDELGLSILSTLPIENERFTVLETIESQKGKADFLLIDAKDLMPSVENDLLEILSNDYHSNQSLQSEGEALGTFAEINILTILETPQAEGIFQLDQGKLCFDNDFTKILLIFEEIQILNIEISDVFDAFICLQRAIEPESCYSMFREEMNFKNFTELVVSPELAFTDGIFKSLPTPVLCDHEKTRSLDLIFEDVLSKLKHQPLPASNDIYLDWHLLEENIHSREVPLCGYACDEIVSCSIEFDWEFSEGDKWVFDFVFSDTAFTEPCEERCKEPLNTNSALDDHTFVPTSGELLDDSCPKLGTGKYGRDGDAEKATLLFKSMSAFDDLAFFMNPQKAVIEENVGSRLEASRTENHPIISSDSNASCTSGGMHLKTENVIFHRVGLSDNIVALARDFEKSYLALLKDEEELISALSADRHQLLSISKGKLMDCIRKANISKTCSGGDVKTFMFALLLAIKQMTWYMCFFGIHVAHLYLNKLCRSSNPMKLGLHALYSSIERARMLVDIDITRSHPSLALIQGILQSTFAQTNSKALILADQIFWSSLKRLLMSMGLSYNVLNSPSSTVANQADENQATEFKMSEIGSLLSSDCLIVAHKQVSPTLQFESFSIVVEYGGSYASARIFSDFPKLPPFPCFHFIKVELDMSSACEQLCEGVAIPHNPNVTKVDDPVTSTGWLEELLNFVPLDDVCSVGSSEATDEFKLFSMPQQSGGKSGLIQEETVSGLRAVVVVNTRNADKEMIVSRRSTYQKILAMEKEGVQVVERDSDIPVDLMLSSAVCLLWYDCENISTRSAAAGRASSSSLSWIGDIATNVLTLLSFTFSCCIMVFEGETGYLTTIMESSDELYAAAASLGINLQIFCSSSTDLTDEIILRCITYPFELTQVQAKMLESESLAESFLTKFPSVNPLTSHAILSSGSPLIEFMKLPRDSKVQRMKECNVSEESVDLFTALCRYGAREDSKSVMTESSSSISSGADSDTYRFSVLSASKKQQYTDAAKKVDSDADELVHFDSSTKLADAHMNPSGVIELDYSWPSGDPEILHFEPLTELSDAHLKHDSWLTRDSGIFDYHPEPGSSLKGTFWQKDLEGFDVGNNVPGVSAAENWSLPLRDDDFMNQNRGCKYSEAEKPTSHEIGNSGSFIADNRGEVINADNEFLGEDFLPSTSFRHFPSSGSDAAKDIPRKPKTARLRSTMAEINFSSHRLTADNDPREFSHINDKHAALHDNDDNFPSKRQKILLEQVLTQRSVGSTELPFREEISHCGKTPLSNAIHSSNQQGSPWTIEFLNRIRERSQARQKARPAFVITTLESPRNTMKATSTKRKSPSILEFFKHKGGKTLNNLPEEKKQKQSKQSLISPLKSWTPVDKRAKQSLSFAVNGRGSQTKLVWK